MHKRILTAATALLLITTVAQADVVLTLSGGGPEPGFTITVADLGTGANVTAEGTKTGLSATGTLAGTSGSMDLFVSGAGDDWAISGGDIVINSVTDVAENGSSGFGTFPGGGDIDFGDLLTFTLDLSGATLPAGQNLRLVGFTTKNNGEGDTVRFIADGGTDSVIASSTDDGATDGLDFAVSQDLADGDVFGFSLPQGGNNYRVRTMTFQVVPEPATMGLLALGGLGVLLKRRRR